MNDREILTEAQNLVRAEGAVVTKVADQLGESFVKMARLIADCIGRVYLTGAGTSGATASRTAHLLATCGVPAFYIPPGNALHGESAVVAPGDVLIALSKAGKSADINTFAGIARQRGATVVAWTFNAQSELAQLSHLVIVLEVDPAAEGGGLLPFGSTLMHGALGDALTWLVKKLRGFDLNTLADTHPLGGAHDIARGRRDGST